MVQLYFISSRGKIFDDDIDAKQLIPKNIKNTIDEDIGADKPLVADFVDERPKEVIELEKFRQSSCWKIVGQSGGMYSAIFSARCCGVNVCMLEYIIAMIPWFNSMHCTNSTGHVEKYLKFVMLSSFMHIYL